MLSIFFVVKNSRLPALTALEKSTKTKIPKQQDER